MSRKLRLFGDLVYKKRKALNWSMGDLMARINHICGRTTIQRAEIGEQSISLKTALELAKVLNISLDELNKG